MLPLSPWLKACTRRLQSQLPAFGGITRILSQELLGSGLGKTAARHLRGRAAMLLALSATTPLAAIAADRDLTRSLLGQAVARERVSKDPVRTATLNCQVGGLGNPKAQYSPRWMLANGRSVPRNHSPVAELIRVSKAQRHQHAGHMLTLLKARHARTSACIRTALNASPRGIHAAYTAIGGTDPSGVDPSAGLSSKKQEIADLVRELAPLYGIDPTLALAFIRIESNFDSHVLSPKNAQGLMQLIPDTANRFNVRNAFDPADNIHGGLTYLRWLLAYYQGRVVLAAAAYNAGEGAVNRYRGVPPYEETQEYVWKIKKFFRADQHPYDKRVVDPSPAFVRRGSDIL
jgi:soluble lytic murein transglycosylase-like protein